MPRSSPTESSDSPPPVNATCTTARPWPSRSRPATSPVAALTTTTVPPFVPTAASAPVGLSASEVTSSATLTVRRAPSASTRVTSLPAPIANRVSSRLRASATGRPVTRISLPSPPEAACTEKTRPLCVSTNAESPREENATATTAPPPSAIRRTGSTESSSDCAGSRTAPDSARTAAAAAPTARGTPRRARISACLPPGVLAEEVREAEPQLEEPERPAVFPPGDQQIVRPRDVERCAPAHEGTEPGARRNHARVGIREHELRGVNRHEGYRLRAFRVEVPLDTRAEKRSVGGIASRLASDPGDAETPREVPRLEEVHPDERHHHRLLVVGAGRGLPEHMKHQRLVARLDLGHRGPGREARGQRDCRQQSNRVAHSGLLLNRMGETNERMLFSGSAFSSAASPATRTAALTSAVLAEVEGEAEASRDQSATRAGIILREVRAVRPHDVEGRAATDERPPSGARRDAGGVHVLADELRHINRDEGHRLRALLAEVPLEPPGQSGHGCRSISDLEGHHHGAHPPGEAPRLEVVEPDRAQAEREALVAGREPRQGLQRQRLVSLLDLCRRGPRGETRAEYDHRYPPH